MSKRKAEDIAIISKKNKNEVTPEQFMSACLNGNLYTVKQYLEAGQNPNIDDMDTFRKSFPLKLASKYGYIDIVKELIKYDVDVNKKSGGYDGDTALHVASENNHADVVEELINAGADVNQLDIGNHTPVSRASRTAGNDAVQTLIKLGADIHIYSTSGWDTLYLACINNCADVVRTLMPFVSLRSLMMALSRYNILKIFQILSNEHKRRINMYKALTQKLAIGQQEPNSLLSCFPHDMIREIIKNLKLVI